MWRIIVVCCFLSLTISPLAAHRLQVFATVKGELISGHAFFTGGGRPAGATITIKPDKMSKTFRTKTAKNGVFSVRVPVPGPYVLTINAGEGHVAKITLQGAHTTAPTAGRSSRHVGPSIAGPAAVSAHHPDIVQAIDKAVERHVTPLRQDLQRFEAQIRFKDIIAGLAMIVGLAGIALWAHARQRDRGGND